MRRLTFHEREIVAIGPSHGLSEGEAAGFARLQPSLPAGVLRWEHKAIRFGPFCGVLRAGGVAVELLPKIDGREDRHDSTRGLLVTMLRATGALVAANLDEVALGHQRMHLLDQFILDFCARVSTALRGGAIARYQAHAENLNALRGGLRLTEHLRQNAFDQSRLFCAFDERTVDNPHNRALKAILAKILPHTISAQAKATVAGLLHRFQEIAQVPTSPRDIDRLPFDRMIRRWQPVFERAKWLLKGLYPDVRFGEINGTCLLFNMERLFEAFLGVKLREAWQNPSFGPYRVELQGPPKFLAQSERGAAFSLRPDITVLMDGQAVRIFDAKWKRLDPAKSNSGISPSDVYQMATYASRYGCNIVALVYPASAIFGQGMVHRFRLNTTEAPVLEVHAVDLFELAGGKRPATSTVLYPSSQSDSLAMREILGTGASQGLN